MSVPAQSEAANAFLAARDFLLRHREDYDTARRDFRWPRMSEFNWALDWFDTIGERADRTALWMVEEDGRETEVSFSAMSRRSNQVANWLRGLGVSRGDRIVLMLGNQVELWETVLAAMKLGAVVIPATPLLGSADLRDRVDRGRARFVVTTSESAAKFADVPGDYGRIAVGEPVAGWESYADSAVGGGSFTPDGPTRADDPLLLYFTSGTTAQPKLVEHTHVSYPVGHLSTMYWIGLEPGDVHLNISSPGWAKHAWSNVFAPWNAEATVFIHNYGRFDAVRLLEQMQRCGVTSFCAPPTVWRMLIQADLGILRTPPAKVVGAGEPLNPEIIEQVRRAWSVTIRDGFGQTETSVQVANTPGQPVRPGSMGRPLPGFEVELLDPVTGEPGDEGEICLALQPRPVGLMTGYADDSERNDEVTRGGHYHTGDVGTRDADGYITYVGRTDDVFKASDYRISPFELESVLLEHEAVAEAAVVPSPDPIRLAVPKAYVTLTARHEPTPETALSILRFAREHLAPYKRVRRIEFMDLPKTISGKIRRVELRGREEQAERDGATAGGLEFREEDFPALKE
ncbi:acetyl-CoA synthetase [Saccharopolyspora erythraea NRRL 2338]|uniref:AMP-dependent synthetase and ligase n=2 Tax=Saccharopolyspora erythraea TaxID=1836 RepID=A4FGJ8_SACEN|nr:AMP-binding protein [Saccharopolyspora erythraea]EQD83508.1 AMP-dependent synthetase [Saccharopolyspora erythraea D]PFG96877.1 acetyl-CoA synthetase [Saccharopolyspora erythraea NRRL 2338]QRK87113.1 AMP-binding protein [Saccharopolyspora erythraea]CAM03173.1 AMP-dependent synthetase and ligase [Saccharopolyspora erythraea NRRL 2338]